MNWKLCVSDPQGRALTLCRGSMDKGDGDGFGYGYCFNARGDGYGDGGAYYDALIGDGGSSTEW